MDAERRRFERDATDAPGDQGRLLGQRVRAGELSAAQVALAASLGDPAAREVAGDVPAWRGDLDSLLTHGPEAAMRAAVAAVGCQPFLLPTTPPGDDDDDVSGDTALAAPVPLAIEALEAWTLDRDPARFHELRRAVDRVELHEDISELTVTLRWAVAALGACAPPDRVPTLGGFARLVSRDELVAWALGRRDPVRDRLRDRAKATVRCWTDGDDYRCGRLQHELLGPAGRIAWASSLVRLCLERVERRPELEAVLDLRSYQGRPDEARAVVDAVPFGLIPLRDRVRPAPEVARQLASHAARVIYNAHGLPAPFEIDWGWSLPRLIRAVARALGDPAFDARADAVVIAPEVRALAGSDRVP